MFILKTAELAWPLGDKPGTLEFKHKPDKIIFKAIRKSLKPIFPPSWHPKMKLHSIFPSKDAVGRYKFTTPKGEWFVRVSSRLGNSILEKQITDYLHGEGVSVNHIIATSNNLIWKGDWLRVDVRPFIDGVHYNDDPNQLKSLTKVLKECHIALANFPYMDKVAENTLNLNKDLSKYSDIYYTDLDKCSSAQCVHGEVHPGNVLFDKDGRAILLDWEESVHSFYPVSWDLAYLFQRFCLRDNPSLELAVVRRDLIAKVYGKYFPELSDMMEQVGWYIMATIIMLRVDKKIKTPTSEYEKVIRLIGQAKKFKGVI